ncbi:hypothetical protein Tco_1508203 [Tanacetum coccineum]
MFYLSPLNYELSGPVNYQYIKIQLNSSKGFDTNACNRYECIMAITVFLQYMIQDQSDALPEELLKGPYTPTIVTTPAVPATEDSPAIPEQTTVETVMNMTPENRAHFESEKEAIH